MIIWSLVEKNELEKSVTPYLNKNMPVFVSWDFNKMKVLLSSEALKTFETTKGRKIYKSFSNLGKLKSFESPKFNASIVELNNKYIIFTMLGHFEKEDAMFKITLIQDDDSYLIHYIHIQSDIFILK